MNERIIYSTPEGGVAVVAPTGELCSGERNSAKITAAGLR